MVIGIQVRTIVAMSTKTIDYSKAVYDKKSLEMIANHLYAGLRMDRNFGRNQIITNPVGYFFK